MMTAIQEQTNGSDQETKAPPPQLPINARTIQMLIQTMAYQEERLDRLEHRQDQSETRFNLWNSSYKNFMQTMNSYFTQEAAQRAEQAAKANPQIKKA